MTGPDPRSALRVSDAERDTAVQDLNRHHSQGRLEVTEWNERVELALRARTRGELATLFMDLPQATPPPATPREANPYPYPGSFSSRRPWLPAFVVLVALSLIAVSALTGRPVVFGIWPLVWLAFFAARRGRRYPHRAALGRHGHGQC